jgi:glycosyltransferase involved in cell wall biosynthesis
VSRRGARDSRARRLLFVGTNRGPGGTESHLVSLATAMANAGYDVAALMAPDDVIARALRAHGHIELIEPSLSPSGRVLVADVRRACRVARPDWIIGSYAKEFWPLSLVARTHGIPLALFLHIQKISRLTAPLFPWLASRFILPSDYLRDWVVRRRAMPRSRTRVLYNPIDVERFRPDPEQRAATRRRLGFGVDDVVVGFAGRFERQKGVLTLADALEELMARSSAVHALWVGHGEMTPAIEARIAGSPHAARHVRLPWSDDLVSCFAAMDVLAFPSLRRESFGRVSAEAQACGLPVVASGVGGIPETLIDGVSGILVPPGDAGALQSALATLVADTALRRRMGAAGRAHACERFALPQIAAEFGRILDGRRGATNEYHQAATAQ